MKQLLFLLLLLIVASCTRHKFEDPGGPAIPSNPLPVGNIETPTFDYQMGGAVELKIVDTEMDATYTVFTFNSDHQEMTDLEVTDPETEKLMEFSAKLPKAGSFGELGTLTSDGQAGLTFRFDIPNDIEELWVRKKDAYGISFQDVQLSVDRPIQRTVSFSAHKNASLKSANLTNFSILWGLNGDADLFTIDLSKDVQTLIVDNLKYPNVTEYPTPYDSQNKLGSFPPDPYQTLALDREHVYELKDAEPEDDLTDKLEEGSWTIAMNDGNTGFYTLGKDKIYHDGRQQYPMYFYPLVGMEDGNGSVDFSSYPTHQIVGYLDFTAPRLECVEGFLYVSTNRKIIQMIPRGDGTLLILDEAAISGLDNKNGGDIVLTDPPNSSVAPEWFMTTFGGLYALHWEEDYGVTADRRSASNLPFTPTSVAYSKHINAGSIWLADNFQYSSIYEMDRETGAYERLYHLDIKCNDLTCANAGTDYVYTDRFPGDDRFYQVDFPSKYGWGSLIFEDMYPLMQDYDFNDVVMDFRYEVYYKEDLTPWGIKLFFDVRYVHGANFKNGFGFVFEGLKPEWVLATFYNNDQNPSLFQRTGAGYEAGHPAEDDAVFMVYDNHYNYQFGDSEVTVEIRFNDSAERIDFYNGFDPFIFVDGHRELEIHAPDRPVTSKGDQNAFIDFHGIEVAEDLDYHDPVDPTDPNHDIPNVDKDFRGYQVHDGAYYAGFPWVLILPHRFNFPLEEVPITTAYPRFRDWANMSQAVDDYDHENGNEERYEDWYSDKPGYQVPEWIVYD